MVTTSFIGLLMQYRHVVSYPDSALAATSPDIDNNPSCGVKLLGMARNLLIFILCATVAVLLGYGYYESLRVVCLR
jgi:hypothetical protein